MADATAVHVRTRMSVAALAVLFVTSGVLGIRHEAQVAHVLDRSTGLVVHAQHLSGHHAPNKSSDIHGQADGGDHDARPLSAAVHQPAISCGAPIVAFGTPSLIAFDPPALRSPQTSIASHRRPPRRSPRNRRSRSMRARRRMRRA
jgi:hypothetical protein